MGISAVAAAVGAVSTISQISQSKKAAKARKKSEKLAQQRADISARRERVKAVREARIRRGEITTGAAGAGVSDSAGAIGGQAAVQTGLASNLQFSTVQQGLALQQSQANIQAAEAQSSAATFGAIGGVSSSIFQQTGGFKTIFKNFG